MNKLITNITNIIESLRLNDFINKFNGKPEYDKAPAIISLSLIKLSDKLKSGNAKHKDVKSIFYAVKNLKDDSRFKDFTRENNLYGVDYLFESVNELIKTY